MFSACERGAEISAIKDFNKKSSIELKKQTLMGAAGHNRL
jgi:hypothetical protein